MDKSFAKWYRSLWQPKGNDEPPYDHIVQLGDPVLRVPANAIPEKELHSAEVQYLARHLTKVMRAYRCVGLAAPSLLLSVTICSCSVLRHLTASVCVRVYVRTVFAAGLASSGRNAPVKA